jgi:hypothetical protein
MDRIGGSTSKVSVRRTTGGKRHAILAKTMQNLSPSLRKNFKHQHHLRIFIFRSWVLLDHQYNIFLFKESVLRTSSDTYLPGDFSAKTSHLTNHCLQEELSPNYGKYEDGNEMFFEEFDK